MFEKRSLNGVINYIENIIDVLNEAVVVLDAEHRVVEGSRSFYEMMQMAANTIQGLPIYELGAGRWDVNRLQHLLDELILQEGTVRDFEINYFSSAGVREIFSLNARCFCTLDDPTNLILITVRDVTALRSAEGALEQKIQELEEQNVALDSFAHHVAHDLKNPISSMVGFASLIASYHAQMSPQDVLDNANAIIESGQHTKEIIDSLLLLASVDRQSEIPCEVLDMHSIVEQTRISLDYIMREHQAELHLPRKWPRALGYAPWIQAVWSNYMSNAIKYGGKPPILRLGAEQREDGTAYFWVEDNGAGLSPHQQSEIFKPFARLAGENVEGHGLGLSVVRRIIEQMGGQVVVESSPGKGSRFGFVLPSVG